MKVPAFKFPVKLRRYLVASEFLLKASDKGVRLVYINLINASLHEQFSSTRYLSIFINRVDDPRVFLYNFPLTRFLSLKRLEASSVVSAVPYS